MNRQQRRQSLRDSIRKPSNRRSTPGRMQQVIYSEPVKKFVESYELKKVIKDENGERVLKPKKDKHGRKIKKNRYVKNKSAYPVKVVTHYPPAKT